MLERSYIPIKEGLQRILTHTAPTYQSEVIRIEDGYDRIVAKDIYAGEDLPGFDRSTVDGFAVRAEDTYGASEMSPLYLTVVGEVFMGVPADIEIYKGQCVKIPTGGMLPQGADAVLMFEHAHSVGDNMIEVLKGLTLHENVILKDEDIKKGEMVIKKGTKLKPQHIGALAGLGITEVDVFTKPTVSIISTGDEIVAPSSNIGPGQVRDINSYTLDGLIRQSGAKTKKYGIFSDDYPTLRSIFEQALLESDIVLISGGTSAGVKDMTARIIQEAGQPGILFHGIAVKPGKPLIGAVINNKPVFGLPGHPAAIFVSFDTFIRPVIEHYLCYTDSLIRHKAVRAVMAKAVNSASGRTDFIRVSLSEQGNRLIATPILGKSGLINTLVRADGIVVIDSGDLGLDAGQEVEVKLF
ncbi:MAG: gephyrin-like molybdotransferase Glp [Thermodesulfovibrionales bacterium]